jgi:hypothetical protein
MIMVRDLGPGSKVHYASQPWLECVFRRVSMIRSGWYPETGS